MQQLRGGAEQAFGGRMARWSLSSLLKTGHLASSKLWSLALSSHCKNLQESINLAHLMFDLRR
jgi:hypothetical protein